MKDPVFKGSCTAMITPFSEGKTDLRRMAGLLDIQAENGTSAVLIAGTTGESATLEIHEHNELVDFCVKYLSGRMKVIAGIGGNNTVSCLRSAEKAEAAGADAVIMTAPFYNKSTQSGIAAHFNYVADRIGIPLIVYNVPSRTGIGISLETYKELAENPNINGVKEASGDISLCAKLLAHCKESLYVWSGNDDNTLPMMALGASGVISVASNIAPGAVADLCSLCLSGNYRAAAELYYRYSNLFAALFVETNPIPVKAAMELMQLDSGELRLPLVKLSEESRPKLISAMKKVNLIQ